MNIMRNQSWEDCSLVLPPHLQSQYEELQTKLHEASMELAEANKCHTQAILARIAYGTESTPNWETIKTDVDIAHKRYVQLIVERHEFTDSVNNPARGSEHAA